MSDTPERLRALIAEWAARLSACSMDDTVVHLRHPLHSRAQGPIEPESIEPGQVG